MTAAERLVAAFAQGLMREILTCRVEEVAPERYAQPVRDTTPEESARIGRVAAPDLAPQETEIDLLARMHEAAREGEIDMSDVGMVEAALQAQREARTPPRDDGTRRVNAPDA